MSLCRDLRNTRTSASNAGNGNNITRSSASDQLYGSMTPLMTPTPSGGVRRRRDSNDFEFNLQNDVVISRPAGTAPITPMTRKRLKVSCVDVARLYDVDVDQLTSFAEAPTILDMLLHLEARLLKIDAMFKKEKFDTLFKTPDFKNGLQDRLMVALLSPGITAYVTDVTSRMLIIIKEQWRLFKVPKEIFEDPEYYSRLETMVSELLTSNRSAIKQKIEGSFKEDGTTHISVLVQKLFPKSVPSTTEHWIRIAFIRSAFQDFVRFTGLKKPQGALVALQKLPDLVVGPRGHDDDSETLATDGHDDNLDKFGIDNVDDDDDQGPITGKTYTPQQFWNYVDDYLTYIRTELFADITDSSMRNDRIKQLFNEALQIDMLNFRDGGKRSPPHNDQLLSWQQTIHCSACW